MKAVVLNGHGAASVLEVAQVTKPKISATQVLLKVAAAGLNRADIAQRKGRYPAPAGTVANILGLEVSGTVVETGAKSTVFGIGTVLFGSGVGKGAILTAVHIFLLTTYYWMLSPIGLPGHGEWLDLETRKYLKLKSEPASVEIFTILNILTHGRIVNSPFHRSRDAPIVP
ncbi:MAG TPA: alcohol dehydrogenase catalytic domain-containing protein [Flavobacteriaceae bacterium]|nr:alcohol dehydrogenase catalytic domain-containing protein [Flavobacteriaceae bacterium]